MNSRQPAHEATMPEAAPTTSITLDELLLIAHEANSAAPGDSSQARNDRARSFFARLFVLLPDEAAVQLARAMNYPHLVKIAERLRDEVTA